MNRARQRQALNGSGIADRDLKCLSGDRVPGVIRDLPESSSSQRRDCIPPPEILDAAPRQIGMNGIPTGIGRIIISSSRTVPQTKKMPG